MYKAYEMNAENYVLKVDQFYRNPGVLCVLMNVKVILAFMFHK